MSDAFDPYYTWLGIPPEDQPADHYRLLGIKRFEGNPDVISNVADQRIAHVRTFQSGPRAAYSQQLLNELSAAVGCLLNPEKKQRYDQLLRRQEAAQQSAADSALAAAAPFPGIQAAPASDPPIARPVAAPEPFWRHPLAIGVALAAAALFLLLSLLIGVFLVRGGGEKDEPIARIPHSTGQGHGVSSPETIPGEASRAANASSGSSNDIAASAEIENSVGPATAQSAKATPAIATPQTTNVAAGPTISTAGNPPRNGAATRERPPTGRALRFGRYDQVELINTKQLIDAKKPFTIEMWARLHPERHPFSLVSTRAFGPHHPELEEGERSGWSVLWGTRDGREFLALPLSQDFAFPTSQRAFVWHHLVLCGDGQQLTMYIDGVRGPSQAIGQIFVTPSVVNLHLGRDWSPPPHVAITEFGWQMDLRAFRISRTQRYDRDFVPPYSFANDENTLVLLDFAKGSGSEVEDLSGNGHVGIISGARWIEAQQNDLVTSEGRYAVRFEGGGSMHLRDTGELSTPGISFALDLRCRWTVENGSLPLAGNLTIEELLASAPDPGWLLQAVRENAEMLLRLDLIDQEGERHTKVQNVSQSADWRHVVVYGVFFGSDSGPREEVGVCIDGEPIISIQQGRKEMHKRSADVHLGFASTGGKHSPSGIFEVRGVRFGGDYQSRQPIAPPMQLSPRSSTTVLLDFDRRQDLQIADLSPRQNHAKLSGGEWFEVEGEAVNLAAAPSSSQPEPIDLLRRINIRQDVRRGSARMQNWELFTENASGATLVITSYTPPPEYTIEAEVERLEGEDSLLLGLVVGGRQCMLTVDGFSDQGFISGVATIDGLRPIHADYRYAHRGRVIPDNQTVTITCTVRQGRITAECDGKVFFDWSGAPDQLGSYPPLAVNPTDRLYVGSWGTKFHIKKMTLYPLGETSSPAAPPAVAEAPIAPPSENRPAPPAAQSAAPAAAAKAPIPDEAELQAAREKVRSIFRDDFRNANAPQEAFALIRKLRETARGDADSAAARFALLSEAVDQAVEAGLTKEALEIARDMDATFAIKKYQIETDVFQRALRTVRTPQQLALLANLAAGYVPQALREARYDAALEIARSAESAAVRVKDADLRSQIKPLREKATRLQRKQDAARRAREALAENPDDADLNLRWGVFQCLLLQDWDGGLPALAKGGNDPSAVAARADQGQPSSAVEQKGVADLWFAAARTADDDEKAALLLRAKKWYQQCRTQLQGDDAQAVARQLQEIARLMPPDADIAGGAVAAVAAPRGAADPPISAPPSSYRGLVGRMTVNGQDAAVAITLHPGARLTHDSLNRLLSDLGGLPAGAKIAITFRGFLFVPESTSVKVKHAGGSSTGGVHTLQLAGQELGSVGDDLSKDELYDVPLLRGLHPVQWTLTGGDLGESSISFVDGDNGRQLDFYHNEELRAASRSNTRKNLYFH